MTLPEGLRRCAWQAVTDMDPLFVRYHDEEWGTPQYDDRRLFEMLCLGGNQTNLDSSLLKLSQGHPLFSSFLLFSLLLQELRLVYHGPQFCGDGLIMHEYSRGGTLKSLRSGPLLRCVVAAKAEIGFLACCIS